VRTAVSSAETGEPTVEIRKSGPAFALLERKEAAARLVLLLLLVLLLRGTQRRAISGERFTQVRVMALFRQQRSAPERCWEYGVPRWYAGSQYVAHQTVQSPSRRRGACQSPERCGRAAHMAWHVMPQASAGVRLRVFVGSA